MIRFILWFLVWAVFLFFIDIEVIKKIGKNTTIPPTAPIISTTPFNQKYIIT